MAKSAEKRVPVGKAIAKPRVAARPSLIPVEGVSPPSDWGSLLADLSGGEAGESDHHHGDPPPVITALPIGDETEHRGR